MNRSVRSRFATFPTVVIIDRSLSVRESLKEHLRHCCSSLFDTDSLSEGVEVASGCQSRVVVIGQTSGGFAEALLAVEHFRHMSHQPSVFLFPQNSSEDMAVAALRARVDNYFRQPDYLGLATAMEQHLAAPLPDSLGSALIGDSAPMSRVRAYIQRLAKSDCPVLITGETGTGKELVARTIHELSARSARPFAGINCAAIPETLFESELFGTEKGAYTGASSRREGALVHAKGGTVLLDEIGEMPALVQAKLLRTIETKQVVRLGSSAEVALDLRFIAATNRPVEDMVRRGGFREDLYFRLAVTRVELPALRERPDDVPLLAEHFLNDVNRRTGMRLAGFSPEALVELVSYPWPGNVRELKNLIEALAVEKSSGIISPGDFPSWFIARSHGAPTCANQRTALVAVLESCNWNKTKAAAQMHWSRMTLYRKLAQYGMRRGPHKEQEPGTLAFSDTVHR